MAAPRNVVLQNTKAFCEQKPLPQDIRLLLCAATRDNMPSTVKFDYVAGRAPVYEPAEQEEQTPQQPQGEPGAGDIEEDGSQTAPHQQLHAGGG